MAPTRSAASPERSSRESAAPRPGPASMRLATRRAIGRDRATSAPTAPRVCGCGRGGAGCRTNRRRAGAWRFLSQRQEKRAGGGEDQLRRRVGRAPLGRTPGRAEPAGEKVAGGPDGLPGAAEGAPLQQIEGLQGGKESDRAER